LIEAAIETALPRLTAKAIARHVNNTLFITLMEPPPFLVDALLRASRLRTAGAAILIPFRDDIQSLFIQVKQASANSAS
jgi:hypothetical protein